MSLVGQSEESVDVERLDSSPIIFFSTIVVASFVAIALSNDPVALIAAIVLVWLGGGFAVRWDPLHPYTIFGTGMMLYAIAAPLLEEFDLYFHKLHDPAAALRILYLSMVLVYIAIWPTRLSPNVVRNLSVAEYTPGAKWVIAIFLPICTISILYPFMSGIATKQAVVIEAGVLGRLSYFSALNLGISILLLNAIREKQFATAWTIFAAFVGFYVLSIGFAGQRTGIYYLFLTAIVLVSVFRPMRLRDLAILGAIALGLNTVFAGLKMFIPALLAGDDIVGSTIDYYAFDERNYWLAYEGVVSRYLKTALLALLGSEPTTVAANLDDLLTLVPGTYPYMGGSATLSDINRAVSLGFLQDAAEATNSAVLFNSWIQFEGLLEGAGVGFCLICTGYLDFGLIGVLVLSIILGLVFRFAYKEATSSVLGLVFYANFVPIAMTSLRQDVSQIISTPLKQLVIPLIIVWLVRSFAARWAINR